MRDTLTVPRIAERLAARSGQLLFERRPGAFREFQSLASRRYCDTAKLRRAQQRAIQLFLAREGLA